MLNERDKVQAYQKYTKKRNKHLHLGFFYFFIFFWWGGGSGGDKKSSHDHRIQTHFSVNQKQNVFICVNLELKNVLFH